MNLTIWTRMATFKVTIWQMLTMTSKTCLHVTYLMVVMRNKMLHYLWYLVEMSYTVFQFTFFWIKLRICAIDTTIVSQEQILNRSVQCFVAKTMWCILSFYLSNGHSVSLETMKIRHTRNQIVNINRAEELFWHLKCSRSFLVRTKSWQH